MSVTDNVTEGDVQSAELVANVTVQEHMAFHGLLCVVKWRGETITDMVTLGQVRMPAKKVVITCPHHGPLESLFHPHEDLHLTCSASGGKPDLYTYEWTYSKFGSNHRTLLSSGPILHRTDLIPEDEGLYHCEVTNVAGMTSAVHVVMVNSDQSLDQQVLNVLASRARAIEKRTGHAESSAIYGNNPAMIAGIIGMVGIVVGIIVAAAVLGKKGNNEGGSAGGSKRSVGRGRKRHRKGHKRLQEDEEAAAPEACCYQDDEDGFPQRCDGEAACGGTWEGEAGNQQMDGAACGGTCDSKALEDPACSANTNENALECSNVGSVVYSEAGGVDYSETRNYPATVEITETNVDECEPTGEICETNVDAYEDAYESPTSPPDQTSTGAVPFYTRRGPNY